MTPSSFRMMALPAAALAFGLAFSVPASAEPAEPAAPIAKERANDGGGTSGKKWGKERGGMGEKGEARGRGFGMPSPDELNKLEGLNADQRRAYMDEKRKAWEAMSDEQKAAQREKNKAAFDSLSPEQKAALKERHMKLREKWHADMKAKFEGMSPEEQEAFKKKMRQRVEERGGKWGDKGTEGGEHRKGGEFKKRGEYRKGDEKRATPAIPATPGAPGTPAERATPAVPAGE